MRVIQHAVLLILCLLMTGVLMAQENPPVPTVLPESESLFQMGMEMVVKGDPKAREVFARAAAADPNHWQALYMRGILLDCTRDIDARNAMQSFDRALIVNPAADGVYVARGNCHAVRREMDAAYADYAEAIRLNPGYVSTALNHLLRGVLITLLVIF